jgi:hypothetical protein
MKSRLFACFLFITASSAAVPVPNAYHDITTDPQVISMFNKREFTAFIDACQRGAYFHRVRFINISVGNIDWLLVNTDTLQKSISHITLVENKHPWAFPMSKVRQDAIDQLKLYLSGAEILLKDQE